MPKVRANGIDLYYEEQGSGETLLLIMGWGGNAATWKPQLAGLAERYRVITFDNRGVGRSSAPDGPYNARDMAADVAGLMDALGAPTAHVFGISMGGMVAQELVLAHPERVNALVLGCTSPGGRHAAGFGKLRGDIEEFERSGDEMPSLEWFREFLRHLWTDEALAKSTTALQDFVLSLIRFPPTPRGLRGQAAAIAEHDAYDRLSHVRHRTLVITGEEDSLVDPENSELLAKALPNARLETYPGLKHAFHLERADLVNAAIVDHISEFTKAVSRRNGNGARF